MRSPPINTSGRSLGPIRLHAKAASAFSDPVLRLFINSVWPSMIENSRPRCMSWSSPPPGMTAVSSLFQGTTFALQVSSAAHAAGLQAVQEDHRELADEPQQVKQAGGSDEESLPNSPRPSLRHF